MKAGELKGQRVLVTGASRGIGQAVALELADAGAVVVGTATTQEGAEKVSAYLKEGGFKGAGRVLNVNDEAAISRVLVEFEEICGGAPTVLVNNAGITRDNLLMRMTNEQWSEVIDTDLNSVFLMSRAVINSMREARYGRIIQIGSVSGSIGNAGQTNYAAAKSALIGFSKALANEVGRRGITVNVVAPGFVDTDMTRVLSPERVEEIRKAVAVGHLGEVSDIAYAVGFLASPRARYITGTVLHVNGGRYMA